MSFGPAELRQSLRKHHAALAATTPAVRPSKLTGKSGAEMRAEEAVWRDAQPAVTRCAWCRWSWQGSAGEGRERARRHRERKHP